VANEKNVKRKTEDFETPKKPFVDPCELGQPFCSNE
jgi:hypothetical protein